MDLDKTIKSVVETSTGYKCYALEKLKEAVAPCTVYRYITENAVISHQGDTSNRKARIQFTCIANTYPELKSLESDLETALIANTTNFQVSLPIDTKLEDKEDNLYYSIREFYFRYDIS